MIEVTGLTKTYGNKRGVTDISFKINEGEIVGFLGPNGAGKTTTMNIITGYISASAGSAKIAGMDILNQPMEAKRHIGYLPEQPPLFLDMTVEEYLGFVYELKDVRNKKRFEHIEEICGLTGITDVYRRLIKNLSKGYKQRVGLAQALIGDPDVLILDEPTVGLDPKQIIEIRNVIKGLGKNRTVILSTHILPEVSLICERVLVINDGVIVADDKPEALSTAGTGGNYGFIVRVAGQQDKINKLLRSIEGVKRVESLAQQESGAYDFEIEPSAGVDVRRPLFQALSSAGLPILMLNPTQISLEDIFLRLTGEENIKEPKNGGKEENN